MRMPLSKLGWPQFTVNDKVVECFSAPDVAVTVMVNTLG
jgi:hypothetical protein